MKIRIKFGTDGYRGIVGDDFNAEIVERITKAIAEYVKDGTIIIGYDPRKDADKFAVQSAKILEQYGFKVLISSKVVPTPVIAFASKTIKNSVGALMFTASHNPPDYLGIKFIPNYGGPATSDITKEIEKIIEDDIFTLEPRKGQLSKMDFSQKYFDEIEKLINFRAIKNNPPKIIYDGLYSSSIGYFDKILKNHRIDYEIVNDKHDPNFGGGLPEPKEKFMKHKRLGYITLANDGDADRYGVIDENGKWVSPNVILAMLLKYLKEDGMMGSVVKTVGVSKLVEVVAKKLDIPIIETPVGFKWIGEAMRYNQVIIGGEDSGGLSTGNHISEKDGIYANLLIMEMIAKTNKPLYRLEKDIIKFAEVEFFQKRVDIELFIDSKKDVIIERIKNEKFFAGQNVKEKIMIDGVKLILEDDVTSILVRKSGTEPLIRFYIETDNKPMLNSIAEFIKGYTYIVS